MIRNVIPTQSRVLAGPALRLVNGPILALTLCLAVAPAHVAGQRPDSERSPAIWLSGVDPEAQKARHVTEPADYMDLFKFGTRFVLHADDAELRTVIDDLKLRHIAFAVELGVLESGGPSTCGYGVEGYGNTTRGEFKLVGDSLNGS